MADWKEQYLAALRARDEVEKANLELYDYCTKLADQTAQLAQQNASESAPEEPETPNSPSPPLIGRGLKRVVSPTARPETPSVGQMRQDLAMAQQERGDLKSRLDLALKELETLSKKHRSDAKKITQLTANVNQLTLKLRDREEEIRGKAKLVENVQDENVTLNLQLNMAEEQSKKLRKENQELVDRWMTRMGKEADRMNDESKFG